MADRKKIHSSGYGPSWFLWRGFSICSCLVLLAPVALLCLPWFFPLSDEGREAWEMVREYLLVDSIKETAILVVGTMLVTCVLGIPAAWVLENIRLPGRRLLGVLLVLPLAIPVYVQAYLVTDLREDLIPWLVKIRKEEGIDSYLFWEEFSRYSILITLFASVLYPYVLLAARSAFVGSSRKYHRASRMLGKSAWSTFFKIELPLARPALVAALFLVSMEVLNDYASAKHFGFSTLTVTLFTTWFDLNELGATKRLASAVFFAVFMILILERWQRGRAKLTTERGIDSQFQIPSRPRTLVVSYLACFIPIALGLVFPIVVMYRWSSATTSYWNGDAGDSLFAASKNTFLLGGWAALICVVLALLILGCARFCKPRSVIPLLGRSITYAGYSCPGTVLAIGVILVGGLCRKVLPDEHFADHLFLSSALTWLLFALVVRYLTVAAQMVTQGLERLPASYERAAASLGDKPWQSFYKILLPLLRPEVLAAGILVFVDVAKELPLCLLLRPFDFDTLSTLVYGQVDQGTIYSCALPSLILVGLCATGLLALEFIRPRTRKKNPKLHRNS